jgi:hypothetical protein
LQPGFKLVPIFYEIVPMTGGYSQLQRQLFQLQLQQPISVNIFMVRELLERFAYSSRRSGSGGSLS